MTFVEVAHLSALGLQEGLRQELLHDTPQGLREEQMLWAQKSEVKIGDLGVEHWQNWGYSFQSVRRLVALQEG